MVGHPNILNIATSPNTVRYASFPDMIACRSYESPGMSWRVGVSAIMDAEALVKLGPVGVAMMAKRIVPACMVVGAHMAPPEMDGATLLLPSEMQIKVEVS